MLKPKSIAVASLAVVSILLACQKENVSNGESESPNPAFVLKQESITNNGLELEFSIHADSSLHFILSKDTNERLFNVEFLFKTKDGSENSYTYSKVNNSAEYMHFKRNGEIYSKFMYRSQQQADTNITQQVLLNLSPQEQQALNNYQTSVANYLNTHHASATQLSYNYVDTIPPTSGSGNRIVTGCISFARSLSIARYSCRGHNAMMAILTSCNYIGTDCECVTKSFWCGCQSYFDC